ncbi:LysR family transcriptional regulator [uncultured Enterovirga sp.]|uniref:LysR family transcriptional regulator n=1 Tax=uncultured Enterovirga sp. TaxID=2026352 RepID=UPI0035CAC22B
MPDTFSSDDLKLVLAVSEGGGLGAAARRLGVDGSTVFRRLGTLEARLGTTLFERSRTGYVPTPAGEDMAALGARFEDEIAALSRRLAGHAPAPEGDVRVTTNDTLLQHLLTPIFARFRETHPKIRLDIVVSNSALNLARRDADVAIRVTPSPPETLVGRRIATVAWALYGWAGLAAPPADFSGQDWVALGGGMEAVPAARFVRRQASAERIVYRVDTVLALADAVEAGIGIGPLPCYVADRRPGLVRLLPPDPDLAGSMWLLAHPDLRHTPRVRALLDVLGEAIGRERARLAGEVAP